MSLFQVGTGMYSGRNVSRENADAEKQTKSETEKNDTHSQMRLSGEVCRNELFFQSMPITIPGQTSYIFVQATGFTHAVKQFASKKGGKKKEKKGENSERKVSPSRNCRRDVISGLCRDACA